MLSGLGTARYMYTPFAKEVSTLWSRFVVRWKMGSVAVIAGSSGSSDFLDFRQRPAKRRELLWPTARVCFASLPHRAGTETR